MWQDCSLLLGSASDYCLINSIMLLWLATRSLALIFWREASLCTLGTGRMKWLCLGKWSEMQTFRVWIRFFSLGSPQWLCWAWFSSHYNITGSISIWRCSRSSLTDTNGKHYRKCSTKRQNCSKASSRDESIKLFRSKLIKIIFCP